MAVASPPASRISRSTVLMVEEAELGSGGNVERSEAFEVVLAATTTIDSMSFCQCLVRQAYLCSHPLQDQWRPVVLFPSMRPLPWRPASLKPWLIYTEGQRSDAGDGFNQIEEQ